MSNVIGALGDEKGVFGEWRSAMENRDWAAKGRTFGEGKQTRNRTWAGSGGRIRMMDEGDAHRPVVDDGTCM